MLSPIIGYRTQNPSPKPNEARQDGTVDPRRRLFYFQLFRAIIHASNRFRKPVSLYPSRGFRGLGGRNNREKLVEEDEEEEDLGGEEDGEERENKRKKV